MHVKCHLAGSVSDCISVFRVASLAISILLFNRWCGRALVPSTRSRTQVALSSQSHHTPTRKTTIGRSDLVLTCEPKVVTVSFQWMFLVLFVTVSQVSLVCFQDGSSSKPTFYDVFRPLGTTNEITTIQ